MTRSLQVMRKWLLERGRPIAAMESTSTYWKGAFYCLEEEVMEVWLVNAAHIKAISRRKTDVKDAEWIAQLLECGLLRPSFVPPPDIRRLRMLTRYRVQLMADRTPGLVAEPAALDPDQLHRAGHRQIAQPLPAAGVPTHRKHAADRTARWRGGLHLDPAQPVVLVCGAQDPVVGQVEDRARSITLRARGLEHGSWTSSGVGV
jgi:hypothetical protein